MNTPTITLLSCPFCGNPNVHTTRDDRWQAELIYCPNCWASGPISPVVDKHLTATTLWNQRVNPGASTTAQPTP